MLKCDWPRRKRGEKRRKDKHAASGDNARKRAPGNSAGDSEELFDDATIGGISDGDSATAQPFPGEVGGGRAIVSPEDENGVAEGEKDLEEEGTEDEDMSFDGVHLCKRSREGSVMTDAKAREVLESLEKATEVRASAGSASRGFARRECHACVGHCGRTSAQRRESFCARGMQRAT